MPPPDSRSAFTRQAVLHDRFSHQSRMMNGERNLASHRPSGVSGYGIDPAQAVHERLILHQEQQRIEHERARDAGIDRRFASPAVEQGSKPEDEHGVAAEKTPRAERFPGPPVSHRRVHVPGDQKVKTSAPQKR